MNTKCFKLGVIAFAWSLFSTTATAQTRDDGETYPYSFIGGAGGALFQVKERGYDLKNKCVPMGAFNLGGWVNPWLGGRFQLSGWKEKGTKTRTNLPMKYKYGFWSPNLDLMIDVTNLLCKKPHMVHAYAIGGVGFGAGRGEDYPTDVSSMKSSRFAVDYRVGAQVEVKVAKHVGVFVEGLAVNMHEPHRPDLTKAGEWRVQALLGLNFTFGKGRKRKVEAAPVVPASAPAPQPEPKPEPKPQPKPEPKPEPKPQPVEVKKTVVPKVDVFYTIGKAKASAAEEAKLQDLVKWLKEDDKRTVSVEGYADAGTGNARINSRLSKQRAENLARVLNEKYGIEKSRILTGYKGDTVQPFKENDRNRVVILAGND